MNAQERRYLDEDLDFDDDMSYRQWEARPKVSPTVQQRREREKEFGRMRAKALREQKRRDDHQKP